MILVESIKVIDSERDDYVSLLHYKMPELVKNEMLPKYSERIIEEDIGVVEEIVRGRKLVNSKGETIVFGWSEQVGEAIGFFMKDLEEKDSTINFLHNKIKSLDSEVINLKSEVIKIKNQSIWSFIKYKFKERFKK